MNYRPEDMVKISASATTQNPRSQWALVPTLDTTYRVRKCDTRQPLLYYWLKNLAFCPIYWFSNVLTSDLNVLTLPHIGYFEQLQP